MENMSTVDGQQSTENNQIQRATVDGQQSTDNGQITDLPTNPIAQPRKRRYKGISPRHRQFIEHVAEGISQAEAYRMVVARSANKQTCKNAGKLLAKLYEKEIEQQCEKIK